MRLFSAVIAAVALLPAVIRAAPSVELKSVIKSGGTAHPDSYIVKLKDNVTKTTHLAWLDANHNTTSKVTYRDWQTNVFHGYAGKFEADALNALRASPDVDYIEEDGIVELASTDAPVIQTNAPWGLQRISQDARLVNTNPNALTFTFRYDNTSGSGVDIYIIDTGVNIAHNNFGGRAIWGATFGNYTNSDNNGHGTHVAGIAGSTTYGVSKRAQIIAVKVIEGGATLGSNADVIAGINYVAREAARTGRPSVANMSLSSGVSISVDAAAAALVASGVHVVVASGNQSADASTRSPAREPTVITVGASNITDARRPTSNYGPRVDIHAPGENVISLGIAGPNSLAVKSGTSMAAPHVAGIIGTYISHLGNLSPAAMAARLDSYAVVGVLTNLPAGTVNKLARNEQ